MHVKLGMMSVRQAEGKPYEEIITLTETFLREQNDKVSSNFWRYSVRLLTLVLHMRCNDENAIPESAKA
jgi:hypothetical protein